MDGRGRPRLEQAVEDEGGVAGLSHRLYPCGLTLGPSPAGRGKLVVHSFTWEIAWSHASYSPAQDLRRLIGVHPGFLDDRRPLIYFSFEVRAMRRRSSAIGWFRFGTELGEALLYHFILKRTA